MSPTILAALSNHPAFADAVSFIFTGLLVVILALLVLSGFISVVGSLFKQTGKSAAGTDSGKKPQAASPSPVSPAPADPASVGESGVPAHIAALLAAAVHTALDGVPHRIVFIEPSSGGWAREGRRQIFSSHHVR